MAEILIIVSWSFQDIQIFPKIISIVQQLYM
jgi:hypothetical protein